MNLKELIDGLTDILQENGNLEVLATKISLEIKQDTEMVNFDLDKSGVFKKTYSSITYIESE